MRKLNMTSRIPVDVTQHLPALRRYARSLLRDGAAADDLVQQALLRAYERSATFRPGASLKAWLLAILHNQYVSDRRRAAVEMRVLGELAEAGSQSSGEAGQSQALFLREVAERFAALPDSQRAVLHLIAIEGLSYRQTADALDVPIGTIMSRLSRARAALREPAAARSGDHNLRIIGGTDAV